MARLRGRNVNGWAWIAAWIAAGIAAVAMAACVPAAPAGSSLGAAATAGAPAVADMARTPISLGVGYVPTVQFAPLYVGIDKGFYAEEGLDVSLAYGYENDYIKLVGMNESQFMIGSGDQVVIGRSQGLPVRSVLTWWTRYPVVAMAKADSGIVSPADLAGKRIGIPGPFGANYVAYRGILEAAGLSEQDVKTESIGFTQAAALMAGTVDAAVDYAVNGPVVLAAEGVNTVQFGLDDHVHIPANGLVTNDRLIEEKPELVGAMVRATARAIQYTLDNPDEAFEIVLANVPEAGGENRDINRAVYDAALLYWAPAEGYALGESKIEDWDAAMQLLQRIGLIAAPVEADALFTNEFLP